MFRVCKILLRIFGVVMVPLDSGRQRMLGEGPEESSGNGVRDYEERLRELGHTTLEERRHQLDMQQVHKILVGSDKVKIETWFKNDK